MSDSKPKNPLDRPVPSPVPKTPALVRRGAAALLLGGVLTGCPARHVMDQPPQVYDGPQVYEDEPQAYEAPQSPPQPPQAYEAPQPPPQPYAEPPPQPPQVFKAPQPAPQPPPPQVYKAPQLPQRLTQPPQTRQMPDSDDNR